MSRESDRAAVADRLEREGMPGEALRLRRCGEPMLLGCSCCGQSVEVPKFCKRKWCPVCAAIAADEAERRYGPIIDKVRSPLFLTLTSAHRVEDDPFALIDLYIASVPRFRALKWFKMRVRGGVGAVEVSTPPRCLQNGALAGFNGYHVHYHAFLDCDWLSVLSQAPRRGASKREVAEAGKAACEEVAVQWRLVLGTERASVKVIRARQDTLREVLKYCVSSESLLDERIALKPLIQAMSGRTMKSPWGSVRKALGALKASGALDAEPMVCNCGAESWTVAPGLPSPAKDEALLRPRKTAGPQPEKPLAAMHGGSTAVARMIRAERRALPGMESMSSASVEREFRASRRP